MTNERGMVTICGLIVMLLLTSLGTTLLMLSNTDLKIATNHRDGLAAQYLAEAGIQYAMTKLQTNTEFFSETENECYTMNAEYLSVFPPGNYTVQTGPDPKSPSKERRLVVATGVVNGIQRQMLAKPTLVKPANGS